MTKQPDPSVKETAATIKSMVDRWYEARLEQEAKEQFERELEEYVETVRRQARTALVDEVLGEGPKNVDVEQPGMVPPEDPLVAADQAFNAANNMWHSLLLKKRGQL